MGFHWRSNKPEFWEVFDRAEKSHLELEDDTECIANCVLIDDQPKELDAGFVYSYRFNDQNYKLKEGKGAFDVHQIKNIGSIYSIEEKFPDKNFLASLIESKLQQPVSFLFPPELS